MSVLISDVRIKIIKFKERSELKLQRVNMRADNYQPDIVESLEEFRQLRDGYNFEIEAIRTKYYPKMQKVLSDIELSMKEIADL